MKSKIGYILLGIVLVSIMVFLVYIIVSKQNMAKDEFNIKKGDEIKIVGTDATAKILNVASTLCKEENCSLKGEVEVSLELSYEGKKGNYTLKSSTDNTKRIKNSNSYLILEFDGQDNINIIIKDKSEINN